MKRIISITLAGAILVPVLAGGARAQDNSEDGTLPPAYEQASQLNYQGREAKIGAKIKEKLGLTDDQAGKLMAAVKARRQALRPAFQMLKTDLKTLNGQVQAKASDADIQQALDKLKADRKALRAAMKDSESQFKAATSFLTPTQRAKLVLAFVHRMRGGWGRRTRVFNNGKE